MKCVHEKIGSDGDSGHKELSKDVHPLIRELWDLILPHMISLSTQAEGFSQQSSHDESMWLRVFESAVGRAFQKTLHLRTRLSHTDCVFNFLWPSPRETLDRQIMQTFAGVAPHAKPLDKRVVAFTSFPGLKVTATDWRDKSTYVASKAVVKLYPKLRDAEAVSVSVDRITLQPMKKSGAQAHR